MKKSVTLKKESMIGLVPVFKNIGMLGCPISTKYGGLGYNFLTYCLALERIGEEGSSVRHSYQLTLQLVSWSFKGGLTRHRKKNTFRIPQEGKA